MKDDGSDLFLPNISEFGPWSGEILINGSPNVKFTALNLYIVFIGFKTWSWYIPTTTLYLFKFFYIKNLSDVKGPSILILFFFKNFIAGKIISFSSL